jgi:SAM-dependent methyltransferase
MSAELRVLPPMNENEMTDTRTGHWQSVYKTKVEDSVSWFEQSPSFSLELIKAAGMGAGAVIDIGGGASKLVDALVAAEHSHVAVLDLSAAALAIARVRLGRQADKVEWIVGDVTIWKPSHHYDLWHDRAAFHFLTTHDDQAAYAKVLHMTLNAGGVAVIGTFALDGPEICSGLPVSRHNGASISRVLGPDFALFDERRYDHTTPSGSVQKFQFSSFRKTA